MSSPTRSDTPTRKHPSPLDIQQKSMKLSNSKISPSYSESDSMNDIPTNDFRAISLRTSETPKKIDSEEEISIKYRAFKKEYRRIIHSNRELKSQVMSSRLRELTLEMEKKS